jgi:hypothetical protein
VAATSLRDGAEENGDHQTEGRQACEDGSGGGVALQLQGNRACPCDTLTDLFAASSRYKSLNNNDLIYRNSNRLNKNPSLDLIYKNYV